MFDKVSDLAERAAVGLSRRAFFTRLGRIGLGATAFAAFVGEAVANPPNRCILNAGCCGGEYPYQRQRKVRNGYAPDGCLADSACINGGICAPSNCCGGTGTCGPPAFAALITLSQPSSPW